MSQVRNLNHSRWECQYHVVFIPKYRKKTIFGQIREDLGPILRGLAEQKESRIVEGHLMPDHIHMLIEIPPKSLWRTSSGSLRGSQSSARNMDATWTSVSIARIEDLRDAVYGAGLEPTQISTARRYRDLFGEFPSDRLEKQRPRTRPAVGTTGLARSA